MSEVVLRIITLERHDWFKHKDGSGRGKNKLKIMLAIKNCKEYFVKNPETLLKVF
jgi:hypothetical protein